MGGWVGGWAGEWVGGKVGEMGVHQGIKASLGERCERYNTLQKVCIPIADANSTTMTPNRAPRLSEGGSWQAAPHRPSGGAHAMPCHSGPCNAMPCHSGPCHAMHRQIDWSPREGQIPHRAGAPGPPCGNSVDYDSFFGS